jgi:hypothetical protein
VFSAGVGAAPPSLLAHPFPINNTHPSHEPLPLPLCYVCRVQQLPEVFSAGVGAAPPSLLAHPFPINNTHPSHEPLPLPLCYVCRVQQLPEVFSAGVGSAPPSLLSHPFQAKLLGMNSRRVQQRLAALMQRCECRFLQWCCMVDTGGTGWYILDVPEAALSGSCY